MGEPTRSDPEPEARGGPGRPWLDALLGRRRTLIVDARYQLRAAGIAIGMVLASVAALVGVIHVETMRVRDAVARLDPDVGRELGDGLAIDLTIFAVLAAVLTAAVALVALLESHRTAGAAYSISVTLQALGEGRLGVRSRLRRNDQLTGLGEAVNRMAERLEGRERAEAEALEGVAERIEGAKDETERAAVARELRDRARRRLEPLTQPQGLPRG